MPSRLSVLGAALCTAAVVFGSLIPQSAAAAPKGKAAAKKAPAAAPVADAKKKPAELSTDERAISKQMQWEDKVLGSNAAKKAELAKIQRAQAITKAAELAAERAAANAPAVREPAPTSTIKTNKSTVALPKLPDEGDNKSAKARDVSAKLATTETTPPPPPARPTDDRFIDKLMTGDGAKKKAKTSNDTELEQLLAKETDKPGAKKVATKRGKDSVDGLLENAAKNPDAPIVTKNTSKGPDWERLEAPATPPPLTQAPVAVKKTVRADDGIIHVVQGANYASATASRPAPPPAKAEPPARAANWKDPFADSAGAKARAAAASAPVKVASRTVAPVESPAPAAVKRDPGPGTAGWKDPFADAPDRGGKAKRATSVVVDTKPEPKKKPDAAPARASGWKDPFSDNASADSKRAPGAEGRRELSSTAPAAVEADSLDSKWKVAARRPAAPKATAPVDGRARWSVLKRR